MLSRATWVFESVKRLTWAQVMISASWYQVLHWPVHSTFSGESDSPSSFLSSSTLPPLPPPSPAPLCMHVLSLK